MKIKHFISAIAATALISLSACSSSTSTESTSAAADEAASASASVEQVEYFEYDGVYELPEGESLRPNAGRILMVDFNADWCAPCKKFRPIFDAAAEKYGEGIDFASVNMDLHPEIVEQYGVEKYPTIVFIMPDGSFDKHEGLVEQEEFFGIVEEHASRLGD